eukprot:16436675-Heterocapsa_arctica.AAC.1
MRSLPGGIEDKVGGAWQDDALVTPDSLASRIRRLFVLPLRVLTARPNFEMTGRAPSADSHSSAVSKPTR